MDASTPILYVEDDPLDVENLKRAFALLEIANPLLTARNGKEALDLLRAEGETGPQLPGLVLLDLGMPIMAGLQFLAELKNDARLRSIPVVVLSGSNREVERRQAYQLGAAGYVLKPIRFDDFVAVVGRIQRYWTLCESL
jgi:CheY-like chemotaxis protein